MCEQSCIRRKEKGKSLMDTNSFDLSLSWTINSDFTVTKLTTLAREIIYSSIKYFFLFWIDCKDCVITVNHTVVHDFFDEVFYVAPILSLSLVFKDGTLGRSEWDLLLKFSWDFGCHAQRSYGDNHHPTCIVNNCNVLCHKYASLILSRRCKHRT